MKKKVAILTINIGKYFCFLESFYVNNNKHFLSDCDKDFFVFTDAEIVNLASREKNVKTVKSTNYGWPGNTLFRFNLFLCIEQVLKEYDYIFFLNSNLFYIKPTTLNEFFTNEKQKYVFCKHPAFFNTTNGKKFEYCRDKNSTAYISEDTTGYNYVMGGIIGGTSNGFLNLCKVCANNIIKDYNNNVLARWHDESHLNRFFIDIKNRDEISLIDPIYAWAPDVGFTLDMKYVKGYLFPKKNIFDYDKLKSKIAKDEDDIRFTDKFIINEFFICENNVKILIKSNKNICFNAYTLKCGYLLKYSLEEVQIVWDDAGLSVYKYDKSIGCYK